MVDRTALRAQVSQALGTQAAMTARLDALAKDIAAEQAQRRREEAAGQAEDSAASARLAALRRERATLKRELAAARERLHASLPGWLAPTLSLDADAPLVLLPLRLETRFTSDGSALRVRIYHDVVHVESLDEGVDEDERQAGLAYWQAVWAAADGQAAWLALVEAVGARRAAWVREALQPLNLAARPHAAPEFPEPPTRERGAACARTLPDRFFVRVEQDGAPPATERGEPIPDVLPVGPPQRDDAVALQPADDGLPAIDASLHWLVDYEAARMHGMAVTVPLPRPGRPVRRVLVYGVRSGLDSARSAERLERLIRSHRFTDGAAFVPQGTPTNNTDTARTAWSAQPSAAPPAVEAAPTGAGSNAAVAARALGIAEAALSPLDGAGDAEQARAAAFHTALWTTTWGDAIEHLTPAGRANGDRRLSNDALDAVRDHWVAHVRGRGPLPLLRLGRQPYGLLPVVATDASWRPRGAGFVENRLVPFIDRQVRWMWNDGAQEAVSIMNRPLDEALPRILGTDAVLRGLRVRTALSPDPVFKGIMSLLLPDLGNADAQQQVARSVLVLSGVAEDALDSHDLLGGKTRSLALPLVHESDPAFVAHLLDPAAAPMAPQSVLQVLLDHAAAVERHEREQRAPTAMHGLLREAVAGNDAGVDPQLAGRALDLALGPGRAAEPQVAEAAGHVAATVGRLEKASLADRFPIPALAPASTVERLAGPEPQLAQMQGRPGMQLVGEIFHGACWSARFTDALRTIAGTLSMEERRLLLSETLDCCSHRLDAWLTAAASLRLDDLRAAGARGLYLGAYGWLEDIVPATVQGAGEVDGRDVLRDVAGGGFIHAPSLAQAATAAVLRSGRLTHRAGDPNATTLDIDLSSGRTRDALALLDGMRQGQSLGALLGYRLERRLHERSGQGLELDRFIYVLRTLAPSRAGKLTDRGAAAEESLAASAVVDGLRLLELKDADIVARLHSGPADTRYIVPPATWQAPSAAEEQAVLAAIAELERTHDAVADLLLAESVHQVVSGNAARAAAAMDALASGEAVPPEPEVVRSARGGVPLQHRLAILVGDPPPAASGWDAQAPRAMAEPRLESWAAQALGAPAGHPLVAGQAWTLADLPLCALDVLYDADGDSVGASSLAMRLRQWDPALAETDFSPLARAWELAGLLRAVVGAGRPLAVSDIDRGDRQGRRRVDAAELIERARTAADRLEAAGRRPEPVVALAAFGVRAPMPSAQVPLTDAESASARDALVAEAGRRVQAARALLAQAVAPAAGAAAVHLAAQALAAVFGAGFVALPLILPPPLDEVDGWAAAVRAGAGLARPGADIRPWLWRWGGVRPAAGRWGEVLLVREAMGTRAPLRVVQTPAGAHPGWIGLPHPQGRPPSVPVSSLVIEPVGRARADGSPMIEGALAGLVIDDWTEVVPRRLERHADPADPASPLSTVDIATTAIALNANAPGARPPQAILLALSPDGADWDDARLVAILEETLRLARMRTLTPADIPFVGRQLPALYFRDWSLQGEPVIDWLKALAEARPESSLKFLAGED